MFAGGSDKPLTRAPVAEEPVEEAETPTAEIEPTEIDGTDIDATVVIPQPASEEVDREVEIPDLQASDMAVEPLPEAPDSLLGGEEDEGSALDEEVSEIIDEVMEIADEMSQEEKATPSPDAAPAHAGESLLDELEQVDIETPENGQPAEPVAAEAEPEPEASSLEEEWAKLLEEDAAGKEKPEDE